MPKLSRLAPALWIPALTAAEHQFASGDCPGVIGVGIDERIRAGRRRTGQWTVVVYVQRKLRHPNQPVAELTFQVGKKAYSVPIDVRGVGTEPKAHDSGPASFTGLHAGARIVSKGRNGGVGCLGTANGKGPTHLLTCGHLFEVDDRGVEVFASDGSKPFPIGKLVANLLDKSCHTPLASVARDAALVELNPAGAKLALATADRLAFSGFVPHSQLLNQRVQAFLPTRHDYSQPTRTTGAPYSFPAMQSAARGPYGVTRVLATDAAVTQSGDSGTVLLTIEQSRRALGSLIGVVGTAMSLFEPFFLSAPLLGRAIGAPKFEAWVP